MTNCDDSIVCAISEVNWSSYITPMRVFMFLPKGSKLLRSKSSMSLTHTHLPEYFLSFQARLMKLSTYVLGTNIILFCEINQIKYPSLCVRGIKNSIVLIFKMVNVEAKVTRLSRFILGINIFRHNIIPPLVLWGEGQKWKGVNF